MDIHQFLLDFNALGPALAAVLVIGVVCYFLIKLLARVLDMFDKHGETLKTINHNMNGHTNVLKEVEYNVKANTKVTERMSELLEKSLR